MKTDSTVYCSKCLLLQICQGIGKRQTVRRGDTIFFPDQPATYVFLLHEGLAAAFNVTESGHENIAALLVPGDVFGFAALFERGWLARSLFPAEQAGQYEYHARAIVPSVLCKVTVEQFLAFARQEPNVAFDMLRVLTLRLRDVVRLLSYTAAGQAHFRLSVLLLVLAEKVGKQSAQGLTISPKLCHEDLAALACLSRPTVTRSLIRLRNLGLIDTEGGRICLRNPSALAETLSK